MLGIYSVGIFHKILGNEECLLKSTKNKVSGAGGIRTRVQTSNVCAFYMLILLLIFDYKPRTNTLFAA